MADPVSLDFLEDIIAVQWRKGPPPIPKFSWIAIDQHGAINAFINTVFTINIAGVGNFQPFSGTQNGHGAASYLGAGFNNPITGGEINGSLNPSGGVASINGFGRTDDQPFNIPHTGLLFKLDDKMPSKPFKVTVTNDVEGDIGSNKMQITAFVIKMIVEGDTLYPSVVSQVQVNKAGMNHVPSVFTFDPKKLKVTGG